MDRIIKGTTPTFTLTVLDDIPSGTETRVIVSQGEDYFTPEVTLDEATRSVSFTLPVSYSDDLIPNEPMYIQQILSFPNGMTDYLPIHEIMVDEMFYNEEVDPEDPVLDTIIYETEDTVVDPNTTYFDIAYSIATPSDDHSPAEMGLYELVDDGYELSQDPAFVNGKDYYLQHLEEVEPEGTENPSELGWMIIEDVSDYEEAEEEDDMIDVEDEEPKYVPVEPGGTENPNELGWVIINDMGYYQTTLDTSVNQDTVYYEIVPDDYNDDVDVEEANFDADAFEANNGLTCIDDYVPDEYDDSETEWVVDDDLTGGLIVEEE